MDETPPLPDPAAEAPLARVDALRAALGTVLVGLRDPIDEVLTALLAGGHALLEGVPGVAKTLLARSISQALGLGFRRIQFTPDLMPADVVGTNIFDFQRGTFHLQRGPVFTHVLLADEINRTPPKTQAALLEAMEERQVTIDGVAHPLDDPFFVIATQNPLEHEGTYPLPEAELDRFLMKVTVGYPVEAEEGEIYRRFLRGEVRLSASATVLEPVLAAGELQTLRASVAKTHVDDALVGYLVAIVARTRRSSHLSSGASPRAGVGLLAAARAWAALEGRDFVLPDDIKRMAPAVLRHRLVLTPEAELEGASADRILAGILDSIEVPS
jgi:MoxR-like ATPase